MFKVGDRILVVNDGSKPEIYNGIKGTIIKIDNSQTYPIEVEFDEITEDCCEQDAFHAHEIELLNPPKVYIDNGEEYI